jgi:cell division protein FtsW
VAVRILNAPAPERTLRRVEKLSFWLNHAYVALGLLVCAGLMASFTSTVYYRLAKGYTPYGDFIEHLVFSFAGLCIAGLTSYLLTSTHPARRWLRVAIPIAFGLSLLLVALVRFSPLGVTEDGARRWLDIGIIKFQPSELLKISLVLYLSQLLCWWRRLRVKDDAPRPRWDWRDFRQSWKASLAHQEQEQAEKLETLERLLRGSRRPPSFWQKLGLVRESRPVWPELPKRCLLIILAALGLTAIQPDLGTTGVILGVSVLTCILAGVRWRDIAALMMILLFIGGAVMAVAPEFYSYAEERVETWLNPLANDDDTAYQLTQGRGAVAVGGLFGRGYLRSEQKMNRLPLSTKDFIYPIIVEELGFVGGIVIITLFLYLGYVGLQLGLACEDPFNQAAVPALALAVTLQALVNIGTTLGTLPLSGLPLPFLSNGGTSLLVSIFSIGLFIAFARTELVAGDRELEAVFGKP